jgi:8-oxo-dGTP pyrophosphatase MutT (NUDIX family)
MLITSSRATRRWIVPTGWPIRSLTPAESAAREAYEEAGVIGTVARRSVGVFRYEKLLDAEGGAVPRDVKVFPFPVKRQLDRWPERRDRETRWLDIGPAAGLVADESLRTIVVPR